MQWIVDELFVGNHLARGRDPHARRHGDRSAQHPLADRRLLLAGRQHHAAAAGARLDPRPLRRRRRNPRPRPDHRLHDPRIGRSPRHLRLAGVARKEHGELASNIDLIDVLPPGLYEAEPTPKGDAADTEFVTGEWVMRCEARTSTTSARSAATIADERRFAAAARVSEINLGSTATFFRLGSRPRSRRRWPRQCAGCTRCGYPTKCSVRATRSSRG